MHHSKKHQTGLTGAGFTLGLVVLLSVYMGLFGVPLIPYFLRFPLPPTPGEALSKWLQLTPASFSPTTPPQLSSLFPKRRELETQGQTYHSPRLTGGKTHKPGVRLLAGESPKFQQQSGTGPATATPHPIPATPICPKQD